MTRTRPIAGTSSTATSPRLLSDTGTPCAFSAPARSFARPSALPVWLPCSTDTGGRVGPLSSSALSLAVSPERKPPSQTRCSGVNGASAGM